MKSVEIRNEIINDLRMKGIGLVKAGSSKANRYQTINGEVIKIITASECSTRLSVYGNVFRIGVSADDIKYTDNIIIGLSHNKGVSKIVLNRKDLNTIAAYKSMCYKTITMTFTTDNNYEVFMLENVPLSLTVNKNNYNRINRFDSPTYERNIDGILSSILCEI